MSSSDVHAASPADDHGGRAQPPLAHHFGTIEQQDYAVRFAMWLFLATEVLLFAGLFLGYTVYRYFFHEAFHHASRTLDLTYGAANTVVLITSSLSVALGYYYVKNGRNKLGAGMIAFTILCAIAFLGIKAIEYHAKFEHGTLPGKWFNPQHEAAELAHFPGASLYFTVYFLTTGLHAFHVIVGASVLLWLLVRLLKGQFSTDYYVPVELGALYWHLVDLVWIFLFPLLYLI
jgi:cytochrome c oxidase subunit 3